MLARELGIDPIEFRRRNLLREGRPHVRFLHVTADPDMLRERMANRAGHYMPLALLDSQLATLEMLHADDAGCGELQGDRVPLRLAGSRPAGRVGRHFSIPCLVGGVTKGS